jgi:plasmid maintenance system antidote protein VapI
MAIRLDKAFGGGAETWLRLQMAYDLAQAHQHEADIDVKPISRRDGGRSRAAVAPGRALCRPARDRWWQKFLP